MALADRLMSALSVDRGKAKLVERANALAEAGSPASLMWEGDHQPIQ